MSLTLLPDLGDLLRLSPQYNAATLTELVRGLNLHRVFWASGLDPEHPARDAFGAARLSVQDVSPDWAWAEAEYSQLLEFLPQYPQGKARLKQAAAAEAELAELLSTPMTLERATSVDTLDLIRRYHAALTAALEEGPGTRHQVRRLDELAEKLRGQSGAALVALDDLAGLLDRLPDAVLPDAEFQPGEASRLRALADRAGQLREDDDLSALIEALARESGDAVTPQAELDYHAAGIYLATGDLASARSLLERAAHALSDHPRSLPGLVLARLGQVRDAQGERDLARRSYQAVQALNFAPEVARQAAKLGMDTPFLLEAATPE
jgi:tetratricopeptide (TPR) repeat protein